LADVRRGRWQCKAAQRSGQPLHSTYKQMQAQRAMALCANVRHTAMLPNNSTIQTPCAYKHAHVQHLQHDAAGDRQHNPPDSCLRSLTALLLRASAPWPCALTLTSSRSSPVLWSTRTLPCSSSSSGVRTTRNNQLLIATASCRLQVHHCTCRAAAFKPSTATTQRGTQAAAVASLVPLTSAGHCVHCLPSLLRPRTWCPLLCM
jgi:hypothetical protein